MQFQSHNPLGVLPGGTHDVWSTPYGLYTAARKFSIKGENSQITYYAFCKKKKKNLLRYL